jgi:3-deoxy-7-phosphoheptulonate synthase
MKPNTDDLRIEALRPLIPPAILIEEIPVDEAAASCVAEARRVIAEIVGGRHERLLVIVGPCSIHDPVAALDYARRLSAVAGELREDLFVVLRGYFEKPRTTVGWKGLINDPGLDGSFRINEGLRLSRGFLRDVTALGLPIATEFLDPISPQFVADFVSWGAIGARTTESQVHRELASGLSMPVGFKNATTGDLQVAIDAIRSARSPHHFLSVTKQGLAAIVATRGNDACHVILRGGSNGPNYDEAGVGDAKARLAQAGLPERVMIDCSHANSGRDPARQPRVAESVAEQIEGGESAIFGVMLESFIESGNQPVAPRARLRYGQSITDGCLSFDDTVPVLRRLARAARKRRVTPTSMP